MNDAATSYDKTTPADDTMPDVSIRSIAELKEDILKSIPKLRGYARSLCHNQDNVDDLVQTSLVKALTHIRTFAPGSNMNAWLYTILRNEFFSEYRKRRHEVEDAGDRHAARLQVRPSQEEHVHFVEVRNAVARLTPEHREAVLLIALGTTYHEAASLCGFATGTLKSRVNRGRIRLAELLDGPRVDASAEVAVAFA